MRVRIKQYPNAYDLPKGCEFEVTSKDDGFYTDYAFYQGCAKSESGTKMLVSFEQNQCEVVDWD